MNYKLVVFDLVSYSIFMISVQSNVNVVCLSKNVKHVAAQKESRMRRNAFQESTARIHMRRVRERRKSKVLLVRDSVAQAQNTVLRSYTHTLPRDAWYHGKPNTSLWTLALVLVINSLFVCVPHNRQRTYEGIFVYVNEYSCLCSVLVARRLFCCDRIHCRFFFLISLLCVSFKAAKRIVVILIYNLILF